MSCTINQHLSNLKESWGKKKRFDPLYEGMGIIL